MPRAKAGNEMPLTASAIPRRSGQRLRHTAAAIPAAIPNSTAQLMLASVSHSVGIKRLAISLETGRREAMEMPKSPRSTLVM